MAGVLIADEQGLGKTIQALAVCEATGQWPAVVICPTTVRVNWANETRRWLPHRRAIIAYGTTPRDLPEHDVVIVGWDSLHGWADSLVGRSLIVDEAHFAKSGAARRTKAAIRLADRIHDAGGDIIALTGTPMVNKVGELVPQLRLIGRLEEFGGAAKFRDQFADPSVLPVLNRLLRARCLVRRRKADVLTELPPKRHATVMVETDAAVMERYRKAEADIVRYLAQKAAEAATAAGLGTAEARQAASEAALRAIAAQHLVAINALRQCAAEAKADAAAEWIANFLDTGQKLVVFGWHRAVLDDLARRHPTALTIVGGMEDDAKQAAVDAFQNDPDRRLLICSIKAAGVGLTLTAASDVCFVEQGWTPADMDQAADRCHRIGQQDSVTAWTLIAPDTIDEDIADLIADKRAVVNAATDGDRTTDEANQSILADLMVRLARKTHDRAA